MDGVLLRSDDRTAAARRRGWRGRAALMGGGVLIALLALEVTARVLLPAPLAWNQPQVRYASDPTLGFRMAPAQQGFTADKPVRINERGLRGALVPWRRDAKRQRVVLLGDSIVFGYGVNEDQAVGAALADLLAARGTAAEVVNAGVPAYSTDQEIAWLEREGLAYRPDSVVVGFCWNDIGDKRGVTVSRDGDLISEGATDTGGRESAGGAWLRNALKRSRLLYVATDGVRQLSRRWSPPDLSSALRQAVLDDQPMPQVEAGWDRVAADLRRLRELADRHRFRPLVMAFPIPVALDGSFPQSSYPGRLQAIAADAGLPFLDLTPAFQTAYRGHASLFIPYDGDHPNAAGHRIAAEALAARLSADTAELAVAPSAAGAAQTRVDHAR